MKSKYFCLKSGALNPVPTELFICIFFVRGNPKANLLPKNAIQSITDFGQNGFGGACPPKGDKAHQYVFTVHALNVDKLELKANTSPALVGYMLNIHTLEKASVVSYYSR